MNMKFGSYVENMNPESVTEPDFWLFALGPHKGGENPLSKLQTEFGFLSSKDGLQVHVALGPRLWEASACPVDFRSLVATLSQGNIS